MVGSCTQQARPEPTRRPSTCSESAQVRRKAVPLQDTAELQRPIATFSAAPASASARNSGRIERHRRARTLERRRAACRGYQALPGARFNPRNGRCFRHEREPYHDAPPKLNHPFAPHRGAAGRGGSGAKRASPVASMSPCHIEASTLPRRCSRCASAVACAARLTSRRVRSKDSYRSLGTQHGGRAGAAGAAGACAAQSPWDAAVQSSASAVTPESLPLPAPAVLSDALLRWAALLLLLLLLGAAPLLPPAAGVDAPARRSSAVSGCRALLRIRLRASRLKCAINNLFQISAPAGLRHRTVSICLFVAESARNVAASPTKDAMCSSNSSEIANGFRGKRARFRRRAGKQCASISPSSASRHTACETRAGRKGCRMMAKQGLAGAGAAPPLSTAIWHTTPVGSSVVPPLMLKYFQGGGSPLMVAKKPAWTP